MRGDGGAATTVAATMVCGGHRGWAVVASGAPGWTSLLHCILMLLLVLWFLTRFSRVATFWASLACFNDHQEPKNHYFYKVQI